jgi:hypothetical protein
MLAAIGVLLYIGGALVAIAAHFWITVDAFQRHLAWGICCLLSGIGQYIYVGMYWKSSRRAFLVEVAGIVAMLLGAWLADVNFLFFV